jgi:hypothetical protein
MQIYDNVSDILNGNNSYLFESCAKNNCFPNADSNWFNCHLPDCDYSTLKIDLMITLKIMCPIVWIKKFPNTVNHFSMTQKLREN